MAPTTETTTVLTTPKPTTATQTTTASTTQSIRTTTPTTPVLTTPRQSTTTATTTTTTTATTASSPPLEALHERRREKTTIVQPSCISGHIELCQEYIKTDATRNIGFVGQYGQFCYELVDTPTQWKNAERHCVVQSGTLVHVLNQNEQDYIVRFLNNHTYVKAVWLGLTDIGVYTVAVGNSTEGSWQWSSGAPYTYNNFGKEFASHTTKEHNDYDCVVMKQGGEWTDLPCGVPIALGFGFGESHPYICQYNASATLPSILDFFKPVVVG